MRSRRKYVVDGKVYRLEGLKPALEGLDPELKAVRNLAEAFFIQAQKFSGQPVFSYKSNGRWVDISYQEAAVLIRRLAQALKRLGVKKDDKLAILSENRPEWALSDIATLALGAIDVPVYATETPEHIAYLLEHSESRMVFVSNKDQLAKLFKVKEQITRVERVIVFDEEGVEFNEGILSWKSLVKNEEPLSDEELKGHLDSIGRDDVATLIYTSGTTGVPKGAMLTHNNLISNALGSLDVVPSVEEPVLLSFLPLSHSFERTCGYYTPLFLGAKIAYAESLDKLPENLKEVRPHIIISVPRVYEKMYMRIQEGLKESSPIKRGMFSFALKVGKSVLEKELSDQNVPLWLHAAYVLADKLVYSKVRQFFGGRFIMAVSGGAPLSKDIAEFFSSLSLIVLEGYGLTETSPVVCANRVHQRKLGTVGKPIPGVEVKLAPDGELLVRGPNVMKGYYKMDKETKEVLEPDGWLHTGDVAEIDSEGFVRIVDRKKDLLVTAGGKNVAPQPIENMLKTFPIIGDVCVVGDKKKFISALIVPNPEEVKKLLGEQEYESLSAKDLVQHPKIHQAIQEAVDTVNARLARYEQIKRFAVLSSPFSLESGEITPTLKVRRKAVIDQYIKLIDGLYEEPNQEDQFKQRHTP